MTRLCKGLEAQVSQANELGRGSGLDDDYSASSGGGGSHSPEGGAGAGTQRIHSVSQHDDLMDSDEDEEVRQKLRFERQEFISTAMQRGCFMLSFDSRENNSDT